MQHVFAIAKAIPLTPMLAEYIVLTIPKYSTTPVIMIKM